MFATVVGMELLKLRRSKVPWLTWLAFSVAPVAGGLFMWILKEPDRARALGLLVAAMFAEGVVIGLALDLEDFSAGLLVQAAGEVALCAAMCCLLVPPVAWIATLGRGYLPPLGFGIFTLVLGNIFAATGWGKWFPYSIVPLYTGIGGPRMSVLEPGSYAVVLGLFAAGIMATLWQVSLADNLQ